MIPEAAVEAAARRMHAQENAREDVGEFSLWVYEHDARDMLEAAAPHMLAEAWDEGYTTGNAHNGRRDANPYRTAK